MENQGPIKVPYGSSYVDELEEMYIKYIEPKLSSEETTVTRGGIDYVVDIIAYLWTAEEHNIKLPMKYKHMVLEFIETEPYADELDEEIDLDNMFI